MALANARHLQANTIKLAEQAAGRLGQSVSLYFRAQGAFEFLAGIPVVRRENAPRAKPPIVGKQLSLLEGEKR